MTIRTLVITAVCLLLAAICFAQAPAPQTLDQLLAAKDAAQAKIEVCVPAQSTDKCYSAKADYIQAVLAWSTAVNAPLMANSTEVADLNDTLNVVVNSMRMASRNTLPDLVAFFGASADPNGGMNDVALDLGGAKLVGSSTYLGLAGHVTRSTDVTKRISTKLQFHSARRLATFRGNTVFWTFEVGPDIVTSQLAPAPPSTTPGPLGTNIGYALGSGPLVSIPLNKNGYSLGFHAEVTKGSMQDTGWRGGAMLVLGSK